MSLMLVISLPEIVEEVYDYMRDKGQDVMAKDLDHSMMFGLLRDISRIAVNYSFVNVNESLGQIREKLKSYDGDPHDLIHDLVDEMYLKIRHELPAPITKEKNIYSVDLVRNTLEVRLLVSATGISYGIDIQPLIDLVV